MRESTITFAIAASPFASSSTGVYWNPLSTIASPTLHSRCSFVNVAPPAATSHGPVRKVVPDPQDTVPSPERIAAVAAGAGGFTKEQREWSIGEAMVVTGFQFTPVELIAQGDAAVAKLILDARKGA